MKNAMLTFTISPCAYRYFKTLTGLHDFYFLVNQYLDQAKPKASLKSNFTKPQKLRLPIKITLAKRLLSLNQKGFQNSMLIEEALLFDCLGQ